MGLANDTHTASLDMFEYYKEIDMGANIHINLF